MPFSSTPVSGALIGQPTALQAFGTQTFGATSTVSRLRVTLQVPSSAGATIVSLLKNGSAVASITIPIGGQDSGNVDFAAVSYLSTDVLAFQATSFSVTFPPSDITALAYWQPAVSAGSGPYYSDPYDEVITHLRMLGIGTKQTNSLTPAQIQSRQARTDRWIDGRLRAIYYVPLVAVTRGTDLRYPDPIPEIARRWCAGTLVLDTFTDVQPNQSEAAKKYIDQAEAELGQLLLPTYRLEGQRLKSRNAGSDPISEPLRPTAPPAPEPTTIAPTT